MVLISDEALAAVEEQLLPDWTLAHNYNQSLLSDSQYGMPLRKYALLTEHWEKFLHHASPEDVFWSHYYWFFYFLHLLRTNAMSDGGMEQQAFQILEYSWPSCEPDWTELPGVESAAAEAAANDLNIVKTSDAQTRRT